MPEPSCQGQGSWEPQPWVSNLSLGTGMGQGQERVLQDSLVRGAPSGAIQGCGDLEMGPTVASLRQGLLAPWSWGPGPRPEWGELQTLGKNSSRQFWLHL